MTAPILHSRPGATHTLCLAFDGWSIASWNGYSNIEIPAYGGSRDDIISIHSRVGGLLLPFDVNVTTVFAQPELNKVGLAAIGGLNGWYNSPNPFWGITYPGSFFSPVQSYPGLSFVASDDIGTPFQVAAVIAHEFGHQCGLNHQITNGQPTPGAIMGQTYGSNDGWIIGTNENGERQDDVAILTSHLGLAGTPLPPPAPPPPQPPPLPPPTPVPSGSVISFIGDSITQRGETAQDCVDFISARVSPRACTLGINGGIAGSFSGQWIAGSDKLNSFRATAQYQRSTHVLFMFGANDCKAGIATLEYKSNLMSIASQLATDGKIAIINAPTYASSLWTANQQLLKDYGDAIRGLANGMTIFDGDHQSFDYFQSHQELLDGEGVHPIGAGQMALGQMWGTAALVALGGSTPPSNTMTFPVPMPMRLGDVDGIWTPNQ